MAQLGVAPPARGEERAVDDGPAGLQRALVVLGERFAGEKSGGDAELFGVEAAEVFREKPDLFELGWRGGDLLAEFGK